MTPRTSHQGFSCCRSNLSADNSINLGFDGSGFVYGARILTMKGARKVEDIRPGDHLITRGNGAIPVQRVEQRSMVLPAVYVIAGSIGHHQPDVDTLLPAAQTVLLRDWRALAFTGTQETMVEVRQLVDGEFVRDIGLQTLTLHQIFCAAPQVLYADGMELGTADTSAVSVRAPAFA